jgi:hypothetical protein
MAFAAGTTGIERGATQLLFDHAPKVVNRHGEGGPDRVVKVSIPRNPIVVEYAAAEDDTALVIRSELLTAVQAATLETLLRTAGTVEVKLDPSSATTITCVFGPRRPGDLEPIWGHYPENAPSALTVWRCELVLYRM